MPRGAYDITYLPKPEEAPRKDSSANATSLKENYSRDAARYTKDNTPYPTVGLNGISNPYDYPSPVSFSPHCSEPDSPLPQMLRPLQHSSITTMQHLYGSNPHTPRTGTPNTPNSAHNLPSYPQSTQAGARRDMHSITQKFWSPHTGYGTSQPMTAAAAMAASQPQLIAPASSGGRGPPVLRSTPPTYVIGSQGRRGILPSAPGWPAAPVAAKNTAIPVKDADGRFPCPRCMKTYLHTKHLKRHLLCHTGERPYKCVLCNDTFSRSDVLKRHSQKCSIRRGNPTGSSHLSHPVPVQDGMNGMPSDQRQPSRSSSMGRVDSPANGDRRGSQSNRGVVNSTNGQNMHGYDVPPGQRGMPMYGAENKAPQSSLDCAQMFPLSRWPLE
ncbi:Zinc finger and BTB domain-containing protein 8A [Beauveria bassiana]|uniref:Zinc finger and BTB domain-containing protein 8A n=1 Tax=Beauveria bassiana TaxID=176275 RepID=A0A2N6NCX7_BEABA|nr:Zinc finger and BTB domain-containing protein 8A [Beauveria bassiana]